MGSQLGMVRRELEMEVSSEVVGSEGTELTSFCDSGFGVPSHLEDDNMGHDEDQGNDLNKGGKKFM